MPIIETANPDEPLDQGDILRGITLFASTATWLEGTSAQSVKADACLVLSRPCVAGHKQKIVVAEIDGYPEAPPKEANSFDRVVSFLTETRDGRDARLFLSWADSRFR